MLGKRTHSILGHSTDSLPSQSSPFDPDGRVARIWDSRNRTVLSRRHFVSGATAASLLAPRIARASSGAPRTLASFGWNASLTPSAQRAAVQSALSSGEPLLAPTNEVVQTDGPLVMDATTTLLGTGASDFQCNDPSQDVIQVQADKCLIEAINVTHSSLGSGCGISVGPNDGNFCRYVTLRRIWTSPNNRAGIHAVATGGLSIEGGNIWGRDAILWENILSSDAGDNKIVGTDINADPNVGAGIRWLSGGGLYVGLCKFGSGYNHMNIAWNAGASGGLLLEHCSLETCTWISIDIDGSVPFERMHISNNTFGVPIVAIAVRNFQASPWIKQLKINDNTVKVLGAAGPAFDIGSCTQALIDGNDIDGTGVCPAGIIVRPQCTNSHVGENFIRNCWTPVINQSPTTTVATQITI